MDNILIVVKTQIVWFRILLHAKSTFESSYLRATGRITFHHELNKTCQGMICLVIFVYLVSTQKRRNKKFTKVSKVKISTCRVYFFIISFSLLKMLLLDISGYIWLLKIIFQKVQIPLKIKTFFLPHTLRSYMSPSAYFLSAQIFINTLSLCFVSATLFFFFLVRDFNFNFLIFNSLKILKESSSEQGKLIKLCK